MKIILVFIIILLAILGGCSTESVVATQDQQITKKLELLSEIKGKFSFIVIGDNRTGDDVYQKMVTLVMERSPDLVFNTGDMIETPGNKQQWEKF